MWTCGPQWLSENEDAWPHYQIESQAILEKRKTKPIFSLKISQDEFSILTKYDNLKTLTFVVAYCQRFINNLKIKDSNLRLKGPISQKEKNVAILTIAKLIQACYFSRELKDLNNNQDIQKSICLYPLNPFLEDRIIKVWGRLLHANIPEAQKFPMILPKDNHVTNLIIRSEHVNQMHAGTTSTLYGIRQKY